MMDSGFSVTAGQDTIRRFKFQLEYVVLRWLESLNDSSLAVVSELDEDLEIAGASVASERVQVKTKSSGAWTIGLVLPILKRFFEQFSEDKSLSFRLVSNALGSGEVKRLSEGLDRVRAGAKVSNSQHKTIKDVTSRLSLPSSAGGFLKRITFELGNESLDSSSAVLKDRLHRICEDRYRVSISSSHLDSLHDRLLAVVFQRSSSSYLANRTLTATELDEILQIEVAKLTLPRGTDLPQLARNIASLAATPAAVTQQAGEALPSTADEVGDLLRKPKGLSGKAAERLQELRDLLSDETKPFSPRIKAEHRMESARLLWEDRRAEEAEAQCAIALGESLADPNAFSFVVHDCCNFLARRHPQSALLVPHVESYLELARERHWLWVDAMEVSSYATARGKFARNHIAELTTFLASLRTEDFDEITSLHWNEAMALGQAFSGNSSDAVSHLRNVLKFIDADPTHNYDWLRRTFMLIERFLRRAPSFDALLAEFSAFFESKDAWGARADLHKEIAVARFRDALYESAIPLFRTASEAYFRAGAYEGYLLARMMMAACFQRTGRPFAALREYLGAANSADLLNLRRLTLSGLREAIPIAFNTLGLTFDALLWSITYCRLASVVGTHEQLLEAQTNLDSVFALLALKRTALETARAKATLEEYVWEGDDPGMFDLFEGAPHADDAEWEDLLKTETEEVRRSVRGMRRSAREKAENTPEQTSLEIAVGGLKIRASWSEEAGLKWLVLGIISWFELYGADLAGYFSDCSNTLEITCLSSEESAWAIETYPQAQAMSQGQHVAVLAGKGPDGAARMVLPANLSMLQGTEHDLGSSELPVLMDGAAVLRALFLGQDPGSSLAEIERSFLAPREFDIRGNERLANTQYQFGGFMVTDVPA